MTGDVVAIIFMTADHAKQVLAIHQASVDVGDATFHHTRLRGPRPAAFDPATGAVPG